MKYSLGWLRKNLEGGPRSKSNICWVELLTKSTHYNIIIYLLLGLR